MGGKRRLHEASRAKILPSTGPDGERTEGQTLVSGVPRLCRVGEVRDGRWSVLICLTIGEMRARSARPRACPLPDVIQPSSDIDSGI